MMIFKRVFFFILLFTLWNCGYEPLYSKKEKFDTAIQSFELEGDKKLNRKIASSLGLKNQIDTTGYKLIINSNKTFRAVTKDSAGNTSVYKTQITVKVSLMDGDKVYKEKIFVSEFTYNNIDNKFDLSQYQKDIEINLINKIIEKIFLFLTL